MASISSNLKKLRREAGLTQAELGKTVNVSPQTISSWETGRTQPDLDMIHALSQALGTGAEEIIYGKKNKVGLEPEKKKDRRVFVTVLAVAGSLLIAAGLIILLVSVWENIESFAPVFGALPLAAGLGFALWVQIKRKGLTAWNEASAVLWTAGFAATTAIYNGIWGSGLDTHELLLTNLIGTLPVLFITGGIVPFAFILYAVSHWAAVFSQNRSGLIHPLCALLIAAAVIAFAALYIRRSVKAGGRKKLMSVLTLAAAAFCGSIILWVIMDSYAENDLTVLFALLSLTLVYVLRGSFARMSTRKTGTVLLSAFTLIFADLLITGGTVRGKVWSFLLFAVMLAVSAATGFLTGRSTAEKDRVPVLTAAFALLQSVFMIISGILGIDGDIFTVPALIAALASGIILVVAGVLKGSFFNANLGMIISAIVIIFVSIYSDFPLAAKGFTALALGAALLIINRALLRSLNDEEAQKDE